MCPIDQHMKRLATWYPKSDRGRSAESACYRTWNCRGYPFQGQCYNRNDDRRVIKVNHDLNCYKK